MARKKNEFRPDTVRQDVLGKVLLTKKQSLRLLRWLLFSAVCLGGLLVQDVVMSRVSIYGATTDLVPCAILLITVLADAHAGSMFVLFSSMFYVFSGSAPGPYAIAFLTVLGVAAALLRQSFWRRGFRSNIFCAGLALLGYELAVFGTGIFLGLTHWGRFGVFMITWALSFGVMLALYPLARAIQKIGGELWRE